MAESIHQPCHIVRDFAPMAELGTLEAILNGCAFTEWHVAPAIGAGHIRSGPLAKQHHQSGSRLPDKKIVGAIAGVALKRVLRQTERARLTLGIDGCGKIDALHPFRLTE